MYMGVYDRHETLSNANCHCNQSQSVDDVGMSHRRKERRPPQHHTRLAVMTDKLINKTTLKTAVDDDNDELTEQLKRDTSLMCCFFVFSVIITRRGDLTTAIKRLLRECVGCGATNEKLTLLTHILSSLWSFRIFFFFSSAVYVCISRH